MYERVLAAATLGVLLLLGGCRSDAEDRAEAPGGAETVSAAPGEAAAEGEPRMIPETPPEEAMAALEGGLAPAAVSLTPVQLEVTKAEASRTWKVEAAPLRVIVLDYPSPQAAAEAIEEVVGWANGSGLLHHAEATANMTHIVIIGTTTSDRPTPEVQGVVDRYMDAFIGAPR